MLFLGSWLLDFVGGLLLLACLVFHFLGLLDRQTNFLGLCYLGNALLCHLAFAGLSWLLVLMFFILLLRFFLLFAFTALRHIFKIVPQPQVAVLVIATAVEFALRVQKQSEGSPGCNLHYVLAPEFLNLHRVGLTFETADAQLAMVVGAPGEVPFLLLHKAGGDRVVTPALDIDHIGQVDPVEGKTVFDFVPFADPSAGGGSLRLAPGEYLLVDEDAGVVGPTRQLYDGLVFVIDIDLPGIYACRLEN